MIVYLPASVDQAVRLRAGEPLPGRRGYAATPSLLAAAGFAPRDQEDAGYTALSHAGVQALLAGPTDRRLVLAADTDRVTDLADPYGAVEVADLAWRQVWALYYDEPEAADAVRAAADSVRPDDTVAEALGRPEVGRLLDEHDLLWFDPTELDRLP